MRGLWDRIFYDLGYPRFVTRHARGIVASLLVALVAASVVGGYLLQADPLPLCTAQHIETRHRSAYTTIALIGKVIVTTYHPAYDYDVTICDVHSATVTVPEKPVSALILTALETFALVYGVLAIGHLLIGVMQEGVDTHDPWFWVFTALFLAVWLCVAIMGLALIGAAVNQYRTQ